MRRLSITAGHAVHETRWSNIVLALDRRAPSAPSRRCRETFLNTSSDERARSRHAAPWQSTSVLQTRFSINSQRPLLGHRREVTPSRYARQRPSSSWRHQKTASWRWICCRRASSAYAVYRPYPGRIVPSHHLVGGASTDRMTNRKRQGQPSSCGGPGDLVPMS